MAPEKKKRGKDERKEKDSHFMTTSHRPTTNAFWEVNICRDF
jgi:hypothetical protein